MKRIIFVFAVLLTICTFAPTSGQAIVIYDNGMDHIENARMSSDGNKVANDFIIEPGGVITDVHWRGVYLPVTSIPDVDDFFIRFYDNAGGVPTPPGTHVYEAYVGAVGRTDTGLQIEDATVYEYGVDIAPFFADPGVRYWIEIFNDITSHGWYWAFDSDIGDGVHTSFGPDWIPTGDEHSFQLTSVPEPATLLLLGSGLVGLGIFRKKFRKR